MMRRILYTLVLILLVATAIFSCRKKPVYLSEPVIAYKDFLRYGNPSDPDSAELVVSFTDNEGDIGLGQGDTANSIFKLGNFFMVYFYDSLGYWAAFDATSPPFPPFDTLKIPFRVPPVLQEGDESEPMKGLIYAKLLNPKLHNKIKYVVYMYDKAVHKSNTIESPAIQF